MSLPFFVAARPRMSCTFALGVSNFSSRGPVFRGKIYEGGAVARAGPWGKEWLQFLVKLRALKGFRLDRGAWHGSGEALDKTLVDLLEGGGG